MFFIGFFSSPLPYLLLTGLYLSGYIFCCLQQAEPSPEHPQVVARVVQIASQDDTASHYQQAFQWPATQQALAAGKPQIASVADPPHPEPQGLTHFYCYDSTASHPIRPPPDF